MKVLVVVGEGRRTVASINPQGGENSRQVHRGL